MLHLRKREDSCHKFLLEAAPSSKLSQLRRKIRELGGCYIDSKYFEKGATHLVTDTIRCSEKFLGACVRGLWVLPPKYIEDSYEVGLWLDEEDYEYNLDNKDQPSDLIAAARRWRWKVSTFQEHPFTGMQVALAMESNSIFYEKLLSYGGAQIFKLPIPLHDDIHLPQISFVFMDLSYKKHAARLTEFGLVCLHYMYITDSIIKDEELDILNYMIRDGINISDSLDKKLYHLTGQKETPIVDIDLCDQTNILEIKVDSNLSGIHLTIDSGSVPLNGLSVKQKHKQQNNIGGTSKSLDFSAHKSQIKAVYDHSILNKTKHRLSESLNNGVQLNKSTMFLKEDNSELMSKEKAVTKTIEEPQPQPGSSQPDVSEQKNISRVLIAPGHKRKLTEAHNYGYEVSKKCHLDESPNNIHSDTLVCTSHATKEGIKLSIISKTGKHNSEYQGKRKQELHLSPVKNDLSNNTISQKNFERHTMCKQNQAIKAMETKSSNSKSRRNLKCSPKRTQRHVINVCLATKFARKLVYRAKKSHVRHKNKTVSQSKSLPLLQVNDHLCDLNQQSNDLHVPTTKVDDVTVEIAHKGADINSDKYDSSSDIDSDFGIYSTVHEDSTVLSSTSDPPNYESSVAKYSTFNNRYRSLWGDSIVNIYTGSQPLQIKQEICEVNPSVSLSLTPNIYLFGLNPTSPIPPTSIKKISPPLEKSACQSTKAIASSSISLMSKGLQTRLDQFGFSPLTKGKNMKKTKALSVDHAESSNSDFRSNRKQDQSTRLLPKPTDNLCTKRGLAKRKYADAFVSVSQTELTNSEILPLPQIDGNDQISSAVNENIHSLIVISDDDSNSDIETKDSHIKIKDPSSKSSCGISLIQETIANDAAIDNSKPARRISAENLSNSSISLTEKQELPTRFKPGARICASSLENPLFKSDNVSGKKLIAAQATNQEHSKRDRSLFDSILNLVSDLKANTTNGCSSLPLLQDTQKTQTFACSQSIMPAENVLVFREDERSTDIKRIDLFKKDDISDTLPVSSCSSVEDYIDLPTPPSVVVSMESDTEDIPDISCTASSITTTVESNELCFGEKPCITRTFSSIPKWVNQLSLGSEKELCDKNVIPSTAAIETPVLFAWPLTYPLLSNASFYTDKPSLPSIYGKWVESYREMGFYDYAITHASPTSSSLPSNLLLSELLQLVWCEDVGPQAITYLYTWLGLHPPVTTVTINLYLEAFELTSEHSVLLDIIKSVSEESKHKSAVLLLEYFVSLFEVNFNFCLQSKNKNLIKNCLIIKWIWGHSYAVVGGGILRHLRRLFGDVISAAQLDYRACTAACALLNMACECLRLAGVQWNQDNPTFIMDSVIALSHDLAKQINDFCTPGSDKSKMIVLSMFKPAWLRTLLAAILLSYYNQDILSDPIHVNKISLSSIVSQFFFLVPQLEPIIGPDSKGAENLEEQNSHLKYTSKPLEEMHDLSKNKTQKGTLTANKVNKRNGKGESAIHIACMKNKAAELEKLLAVPGADVNLRDNYGWTPLHEACNHGTHACAELLLKYVPKASGCSLTEQEQKLCKVEIDAVGPDGLTPLHDAVRNNRIEVCKLLLKYGGQKLLKSKTHNNYTAMDLAQSDEMKKFLISFCESASHLNLSISQECENSDVNLDAVNQTAPQAQRYQDLTETDGRFVVNRNSCDEFLMLLMVLVASYYSVQGSIKNKGQSDACLDPKDSDVLANMSSYIKLLKRHVRKLTRPEDFEHLQVRLELLEFLCESGPEKE